jgi:hypothetical protein
MPVNYQIISKSSAPLKCYQINLMHSRCAALNLAQLILDLIQLILDIDVVLIQEPCAKASPLSSAIKLKFIPPGQSSFHCLSSSHAFVSAIIIKSSPNASFCSFVQSNTCCGVKLSKDIFYFSNYCWPSLLSIPSQFFYCIAPSVKKAAVFDIDSNSKNPAWNSARTDKNGADLEYCFIYQALSISNVDTSFLPLKPSNASFVDVTLAGDSVSLIGWHFPIHPSLSDHPLISFDVAFYREMGSPASSVDRLRFPQFCSIPLFVSCLECSLVNIIRPDDIHAINSTKDIDDVISSLNLVVKSAALKINLAFHRSPQQNETLLGQVHLLVPKRVCFSPR